jgi:hypothetical protein
VTFQARSDRDAGDDLIERHATTGPVLPYAAAHFSSRAPRDQLSASHILKGYHPAQYFHPIALLWSNQTGGLEVVDLA